MVISRGEKDMASIFDYLTWRGDLSFSRVGVNPVDALIFSALSYIQYGCRVEKEPMTADDSLLAVKATGRLQMTPHMAWASIEARQRCVDETCLNIEAFLQGKDRNLV